MATCATCKHFIGAGDWNLCCDLKYDLCYEHTLACDKYELKMASWQKEHKVCCKCCERYEPDYQYCFRYGTHVYENDMCGEFKRKKDEEE